MGNLKSISLAGAIAFMMAFSAQADLRLFDAIVNGDEDAIRSLRQMKVDFNAARENDGRRPLDIALMAKQEGIVDILLESGADVNAVNPRDGSTPLFFAIQSKNLELVRKILLRKPNLEVPIGNLKTRPLHFATDYGTHEIVVALLEQGVAVDSLQKNGSTALMIASDRGKLNVVETLLESGADPSNRAQDGTVLHLAAQKCHTDIVRTLSNRGIDLNEARQNDGMTPLALAVTHGCPLSLIEELLEKGAKIDLPISDGRTPLLLAAQFLYPALGNALLEHGASPDLATKGMRSRRLMLAAMSEDVSEIIDLLEEAGEFYDPDLSAATPLILAHSAGHRHIVEALVQSEECNFQREMRAALHFGHKELIPYLLKKYHSLSSDKSLKTEIQTYKNGISELFNDSCAICFENINNPELTTIFLTQCSHVVCETCLEKCQKNWKSTVCPICREQISRETSFSVETQ